MHTGGPTLHRRKAARSPDYPRPCRSFAPCAFVRSQSDPDSGCSPDTAAIFDISFGAERIVRRDRFRVLTAPTTMVDDEVWSFRRRQTFLGQGDSLPVRPSVSGRYVYPTNERGAEEVRVDLSDDIVSMVILASDAEDTALALNTCRLLGSRWSSPFARRPEPAVNQEATPELSR